MEFLQCLSSQDKRPIRVFVIEVNKIGCARAESFAVSASLLENRISFPLGGGCGLDLQKERKVGDEFESRNTQIRAVQASGAMSSSSPKGKMR
jgi:hypothetical protein